MQSHEEQDREAGAAEILDRERLSISTRDDPDLERTLCNLFLDSTPELLRDLDRALDRGDADAAERLAHKLQGSCATLGALALGAAVGRLQRAVPAGDPIEIATLLEQARLEFDRVEQQLVRSGDA